MARFLCDNTDSFNGTNYFALTDERSEILAWLSPLDPRIWHKNIQTMRVDRVGDWFLQTREFRDWYGGSGEDGSDSAVLFCCGDLGVGKTYITSLVIDELAHQTKGQNTAVVCSYHDFTARGAQSPTNVLGSLLQQLVSGLDDIPAELVNAFKNRKMALGGQPLQLAEIVSFFRAITSSRRVLICIDALDECAVRDRPKLLRSLRNILQGLPRARLFLTGRPHIQSEIKRQLGGAMTIISITTDKRDVVRYLHAKLGEDPAPDAMDSGLEVDIVNRVTGTMSKMFRLVSLNIDGILRETTIHRRRKRLDGMMDGLDLGIVYGPTLERIRAEGEERLSLALTALMWICYSERPLHMDELCHALAVEIGNTDFESDNVPSEGTLLGCCQGLVIVDSESSIACLIHSTLQEYLCAHSEYFASAHSTIAETCLTYLNSQQVKDLSANPSPDLRDTPFLSYASRYWGIHAKMEPSGNTKSLALQLFNQYDGHVSGRLLLQQVWSWGFAENGSTSVFTGLHCASFFGIAEVVDALMGMKSCGINQRDWVGVTPLIWAAMYGHQDVVKLLLGQEDVDPSIPDRGYGRTALSWAKVNGHEGVVKLLLEREGGNPDGPDGNSRTALPWAIAPVG